MIKRKNVSKLEEKFSGTHRGGKSKRGAIDTILANLFEQIMWDIGMGLNQWNHLMLQWISDPNKCIPDNMKDKSSARGNLQKELLKPRMSWQVFCKGLKFLNIRKFKITITAYHANNKETLRDFMVDFGEQSFDETKDVNEDTQ